MKLLFDHNLPPLLVSRLADLFPHSQHVFALGLDRTSDWEIRDFAQRGAAISLSQRMQISAIYACSSDFRRKSFGFAEETVRQEPLKKSCVNITKTLRYWK